MRAEGGGAPGLKGKGAVEGIGNQDVQGRAQEQRYALYVFSGKGSFVLKAVSE